MLLNEFTLTTINIDITVYLRIVACYGVNVTICLANAEK